MVSETRAHGLRIGVLTGPTATGKTELAHALADRLRAQGITLELINGDSLLFYRSLDIGTAKPTADERARYTYHGLDTHALGDPPLTAAEFAATTRRTLDGIHARGARALVVGGSGFYLKALLHGVWDAPPTDLKLRARLETETTAALHARLAALDAKSADRIGFGDRYRLIRALEICELSGSTPTELQARMPQADPRFVPFVIDRPQAELDARIRARTQAMLDQGLLDEVRTLRPQAPDSRAWKAVGYREACAFLDGVAPSGRKPKPGLEGLAQEIELATRQLVKSQRTWFRGQLRDPDQKALQPHLLDPDRERLLGALEALYA